MMPSGLGVTPIPVPLITLQSREFLRKAPPALRDAWFAWAKAGCAWAKMGWFEIEKNYGD